MVLVCVVVYCFFCQAEDGIRDLVRSRGLGDVYKRQGPDGPSGRSTNTGRDVGPGGEAEGRAAETDRSTGCLLYTSDAADERSSVDLGGRRIIKKKTTTTRDYTYRTKNKSSKQHS